MRSHRLLDVGRSTLLVVDLQEKLLDLVADSENVVAAAKAIIQVCKSLNVPVLATEQYPAGLGSTVGQIKQLLENPVMGKLTFSCWADQHIRRAVLDTGREQILIIGIESQVCVSQTALDLLAAGFGVFVCRDAVGSRDIRQHNWALERMARDGVVISSAESAIFELLHRAGTDKFKASLPIIKELASIK